MSKRDVLAKALEVLEAGNINNDATEKLRVEIAAIDREREDEKVCHYYETMCPNRDRDWYELEESLRVRWRKSYERNEQYFTVVPEEEEEKEPETEYLEYGEWANTDYKFKDQEGDVWWFLAEHDVWVYGDAGVHGWIDELDDAGRAVFPMEVIK